VRNFPQFQGDYPGSRAFLPGLGVFSGRDWKDWGRDLVAGVTLSACLLPAGIGDASLAGLPPEAVLYAWLFCNSRHTAITVTSAISLQVGSSPGAMTGGDASRQAVLASCTALMVGVLAFAAWTTKVGNVVAFISETVMTGFKTGVALHLASTQLPKLFGFKGGHGDFWERAGHFLSHLGETHSPSSWRVRSSSPRGRSRSSSSSPASRPSRCSDWETAA
jgi:MFS superfamily sulfate permease-like transporter